MSFAFFVPKLSFAFFPPKISFFSESIINGWKTSGLNLQQTPFAKKDNQIVSTRKTIQSCPTRPGVHFHIHVNSHKSSHTIARTKPEALPVTLERLQPLCKLIQQTHIDSSEYVAR